MNVWIVVHEGQVLGAFYSPANAKITVNRTWSDQVFCKIWQEFRQRMICHIYEQPKIGQPVNERLLVTTVEVVGVEMKQFADHF